MTKQGRKLPKAVIEYWPEVFGDIELNILPLRYLQAVLVNFCDGKTWEIKITNTVKKNGWDQFEQSLSDLISTYEDHIVDVDFKMNIGQVRKDIEKVTSKFLKNRIV